MNEQETCIERMKEDGHCTVFTSEAKYIAELKKLATDYPKDVKIQQENPDGSILVHVPKSWFRFIKPKIVRTLTEEQKTVMAERLKKARENRD